MQLGKYPNRIYPPEFVGGVAAGGPGGAQASGALDLRNFISMVSLAARVPLAVPTGRQGSAFRRRTTFQGLRTDPAKFWGNEPVETHSMGWGLRRNTSKSPAHALDSIGLQGFQDVQGGFSQNAAGSPGTTLVDPT